MGAYALIPQNAAFFAANIRERENILPWPEKHMTKVTLRFC